MLLRKMSNRYKIAPEKHRDRVITTVWNSFQDTNIIVICINTLALPYTMMNKSYVHLTAELSAYSLENAVTGFLLLRL